MFAGGKKRVVLITGASRGLGSRLALGFGEAGYQVAVHCHRRVDAAGRVAAEVVQRGGEALTYQAEMSDSAQVGRMVEQVVAAWGKIDVLINNAAVTSDAPTVSMGVAQWDAVLACNLNGPFYAMRAAAGLMRSRGGGQIINIVSIAGCRGNAGQANYSAAKAGLIGLTRNAAEQWGRYNIRVNAVAPGFMLTDMTASLPERIRQRALEQSCLKRFCEPEEVVSLVKTLAAMEGVSGQVFHLDSRIV
jgi:3-oxoacyl-[acyl-carrier protein] reductase